MKFSAINTGVGKVTRRIPVHMASWRDLEPESINLCDMQPNVTQLK
jgi:hypothetical protein